MSPCTATAQVAKKHGARIDGIRTSTVTGREVLDVAYKVMLFFLFPFCKLLFHCHPSRSCGGRSQRYDERLFGLGLHRGVLFEALREACEAAPNISERFGVSVVSVEQTPAAATVRDANGMAHGPFDLVS